MYIRMLVGANKGKIRDIHPLYARGLIARSEALDPRMPVAGGEVAAAPALVIGERAPETMLPTRVAENLPQLKGKRR